MSYPGYQIIQNFLDQVKKKLPEWLKSKEEEVNEILKDLESQILNEARIIAEGEDLTKTHINQALINIGTPESIAKVYKSRGTPKYFITEELFEFYLRSMMFFLAIVVIINLVVAVVQIFVKPWWEIILGALSGIWIGFLIIVIVVTIVFVYFSHEGFMPEDFGILPRRLAFIFPMRVLTEERVEEAKVRTKEKLAEARERARDKITEARIKREERLAEAKIRREEKLVEAKIRKEERAAAAEARKELKKKEPVSVGELIFGGIAGIIFGLILIIQPFSVIGLFELAFLDWLKLFGMLVFISGLLNLIRLAVGVNNYTGQQVFIIIGAFYSIAYVPLMLNLLQQPEIFPISLFSGGIVPTITADPSSLAYVIYFWVFIIIIIGIFGGMIGDFYKVYKIQKLKH
jgi:hypothetical protein